MKKIVFLLSLIILLSSVFIFPIFSADGSQLNWYCVRTPNHTQPPLPQEFNFIENYNGYYIDKHTNDKVVYLTFDVGYENGNVVRILDTLKATEVKAAFFVLSNLISQNPELIVRMSDEGHLICNHTSKHVDMTKINDINAFNNELKALEEFCAEKTGKTILKYFRPPEGKFNEITLKFADELGYKTIFWSFAYADWDNSNQMDEAKAKEKILSNIHNGAVLLLHPTSKTNADILGDIIVELKSQGYRFGTLDELTAK